MSPMSPMSPVSFRLVVCAHTLARRGLVVAAMLALAAAAATTTMAPLRAADPLLDDVPDLEVYLSFDDETEPGLDDSGNDFNGVVDGGALWVDDPERGAVLEFTGGDDGFVRISELFELPGEDFTIAVWALRDPVTALNSPNGGLFQLQFGGDIPTTNAALKVIGGWVSQGAAVWGRMHQQDLVRLNLPQTYVMPDLVWTHLAYRGDGETFEVVINGESGVGPSVAYDGTLDIHDTIFVGKQHNESWGGRLDEFRIYSRALEDEEIELLMEVGPSEPPECPPEGDTHCQGLAVEGPPENAAGTFLVTAMGLDDSGDEVRFEFRVESDAGDVLEAGPQLDGTASFRLGEGQWTITVTVDDLASCEDAAEDRVCTAAIDVGPPPAVVGGLELLLDFEEEDAPGTDRSGAGRDGTLEAGAIWVDDDERGGAVEFISGNAGFIRTVIPELPGDNFTITLWAYRDALLMGAGNDALFQVQLGGDAPTTAAADKVIGGWVGAGSDVWGRVHQADGTRVNLPTGIAFMDLDTWMHVAYRGDGELFEVFIDGEPAEFLNGVYDGTLGAHDTLFVGKQGTESWGGRIDDFRVYSRALELEEIEDIFAGVDPGPGGDEPTFQRGDADANGLLEVTDAVNTLAFLFLGTFQPVCMDALDWDDNGALEIADALGSLSAQFLGGAPAPPPGSESCGVDPIADALTCEAFPPCAQE